MLIECTLKRDEPVIVPIGNEKYHFEPDATGRKVCEVWDDRHIEAFLAVSHLYRDASGGPAAGLDRKGLMAALKQRGIKFAVTEPTDALRQKLAAAGPQTA